MKVLRHIIWIIVIASMLTSAGYYLYRIGPACPPDGKILVDRMTIDSLEQLALSYKDSVWIDTIWLQADTVYIDTSKPATGPTDDPQINVSTDSLITSHYKVWIDEWIMDNSILFRNWRYTDPDQMIVTKTVKDPVFYPVEISRPINSDDHIITLSLGAGIGSSGIPVHISGDYQHDRWKYGLQYQRIHDKSIVSIDIGYTLFSW